ncbi:hypothetical protein [Pedobacter cryoconitis]|uniref:Uncharacterized protein n=1 Tax=Pedobacter cryoconitis TaxID=188932 RepID=A0A7X0MHX5_9SPHI|nr:hypothetical protein [Pedobacter cryoconitis]MBB6497945.1 hypothetical protein [Pedobacter cryoconitis]
MKKILIIACIAISIIHQSCKKDSNRQNTGSTAIDSKNSETNLAQTKFAVLLAKAVKSDPDLRNFLKNESLKQFDNDHDILYHMVKDVKINGAETLHEKLIRYQVSDKELDSIETQLPLLTIFIPSLPSFSPEKWNAASEVPFIATSNVGESNVSLYDGSGNSMVLKPNQTPAFPVLVIKQNERVIVNRNSLQSTAKMSNSIKNGSSIAYQNSNLSLSFADKAFDGTNKSKQVNFVKSNAAIVNDIDPISIEAYNSGNEWHRDYIYYGLTASTPNGEFKHNYSEFITSFKFLTPNALGIISDQDEDPKKNDLYGQANTKPPLPKTMWTEGNFEIKITILINAKNGAGSELTKVMSVSPGELFDLQYDLIQDAHGPFGTIKIYQIKSVTPKEFHPNIELVPWDLENYGTAWKFIFYETDNAQEITKSYENTSTYAGNFGIDLGVSKKIGLKFGGSATTSTKNSYTVKTTLNSDFLGEAILTFDQPIITGSSGGSYTTREITTGNLLSITVQPKKVF